MLILIFFALGGNLGRLAKLTANYFESDAAQVAAADFKKKIGKPLRVFEITITPEGITFPAQDPNNPRNLDLYKYAAGFIIGPTPVKMSATQRGNLEQTSIETVADGVENSFGFSLNYDATKLSNPLVSRGTDTQNASLIPNTNTAGRVGVVLGLPVNQALPAGTRQLITIRFDVDAAAPGGQTSLVFGDQPVFREVADIQANPIAATFQDGSINILGPTAIASPYIIGDKINVLYFFGNGDDLRRKLIALVPDFKNVCLADRDIFKAVIAELVGYRPTRFAVDIHQGNASVENAFARLDGYASADSNRRGGRRKRVEIPKADGYSIRHLPDGISGGGLSGGRIERINAAGRRRIPAARDHRLRQLV